jgi:chemotaxis methyl-accepting protein methylase
MTKLSTALAVLEHDVSELRLVLERQAGVLLDTPSDVLAELASNTIEAQHLGGVSELLELLRSSDTDCERFLEPLLDSTTGFFSHPEAFDAFSRFALPELMNRPSSELDSRMIRVWSAGCATGEEAYSIAISLCEAVDCTSGDWAIRIVGTDIRHEALKIAERGLYSESAVTQIPRPVLQSYFARVGQHFLVKPRVRNLIAFNSMNLAKPGYIGRFHCIFCVNVLPRFSKSQRAALVQRLHLYLEPGGFLLLGGNEKLPAIAANFDAIKNLSYTLYRKPKAATAAAGR